MLIEETNTDRINKMEIDEKKIWTPYHIARKNGVLQEIYTDHAAIKLEIAWKKEQGKRKEKKWIMTRQGYEKFREMINQEKISEIITQLNL